MELAIQYNTIYSLQFKSNTRYVCESCVVFLAENRVASYKLTATSRKLKIKKNHALNFLGERRQTNVFITYSKYIMLGAHFELWFSVFIYLGMKNY